MYSKIEGTSPICARPSPALVTLGKLRPLRISSFLWSPVTTAGQPCPLSPQHLTPTDLPGALLTGLRCFGGVRGLQVDLRGLFQLGLLVTSTQPVFPACGPISATSHRGGRVSGGRTTCVPWLPLSGSCDPSLTVVSLDLSISLQSARLPFGPRPGE